MRTSRPDESQLMFMAFDLLHQDGVDLRVLPYPSASATCVGCAANRASRLCARCKPSRTAHCYSITKANLGSRASCPSAWRHATRAGRAAIGQDEVPGWKRINSERYRLSEGPRKPELTEAQMTLAKTRQEFAGVLEWLGSPGMPGNARELRKHVAILEREIAELEQA
jgi:hypothetical protein